MARAAVSGRLTWRVSSLASSDELTSSARRLVFEVPGWPGHLPGQHVDVRLTAEDGYSVQRSYSISSAPDGDLVELSRLGTAMMLIRREIFEELKVALPELVFRPDPAERQTHGVGELEPAFFCPLIESESQALLSDDYAFCRRVRDAGFRIWLAPWVRTTHAGPTVFTGTLADTAQLYSVNPASSPE